MPMEKAAKRKGSSKSARAKNKRRESVVKEDTLTTTRKDIDALVRSWNTEVEEIDKMVAFLNSLEKKEIFDYQVGEMQNPLVFSERKRLLKKLKLEKFEGKLIAVIWDTSQPLAIIDNKIYKKDQEIEPGLEVTKIANNQVILSNGQILRINKKSGNNNFTISEGEML